ncbi:ABC transporter permease [uncultured Tateyamaria sp.]|uniref:ABC transporter permease n=1 Tax=Tateyamaria sp. 1078 TaxID=3417464 RepID=UPI002619740D|nr:ABC transporter permease [uncultured Tateyamaria sp.]
MAEVMQAADGTPLKRSLARALRRQKLRALGLIAPLLFFVLITFIIPIGNMLFRSVENDIVQNTLPGTIAVLTAREETGVPGEDVFTALYIDLFIAEEQKLHTRLGSRLNYEQTGASSMFRRTGRAVGRFDTGTYTDAITDANPAWEDPAHWAATVEANAADLPRTANAWSRWQAVFAAEGDEIGKRNLEDFLFTALYLDLRDADAAPAGLDAAYDAARATDPVSIKDAFIDADDKWGAPQIWETLTLYAPKYTPGYFLNSLDYQKTPDGIEKRPENEQIYITLFGRTIWMSLLITFSCIALGYPIAWLLANLPMRKANVLLILVLLPFWTSLLVRTSAWKVMLQQQGVINDVLVWVGLVDNANRLIMINNQFGTIVAMTHILLPFMILPMYSVMQTIPPSYLRAAKSLGATNWTAFWRVYFPQSVPGIGAGSILVFILAIGYYITPEIVGGTKGVFISNRIAYHISSSLNWGLAAALGTILLVAVLVLYWAYDKIVGIDNVKLG